MLISRAHPLTKWEFWIYMWSLDWILRVLYLERGNMYELGEIWWLDENKKEKRKFDK